MPLNIYSKAGADAAFATAAQGAKADAIYETRLRTVDDLLTLTPNQLWSAHRMSGLSLPIAPEGSLRALELAIARGAPIVDVDLQMTSDGVLVIMHDDTWDRTTTGTGSVATTPFGLAPWLGNPSLFSGTEWPNEQVPTLDRFLAACKGRVIPTIEPKNGLNGLPALIAALRAHGMLRSAFVNSFDPAVVAAAVAAGGVGHVYGCDTVAKVQAADDAGAWLVEVSVNPAAGILDAVAAATNIKRAITGPITRRLERDAALARGIKGFVSDHLGWLEGISPASTSLTQWIARQIIPPGLCLHSGTITDADPLFVGAKIQLSKEAAFVRRFMLPLELPTTDYSLYLTQQYGAWVGDDIQRSDFRICCPSDEGNGADPSSRGYVIGLRKNGEMPVWCAPVTYGAGTRIYSGMSTAISDAGATVTLRVDVTATQLRVTRTDTGFTTGWIADSAWRGPVAWASGGSLHDTFLTDAYIGELVST